MSKNQIVLAEINVRELPEFIDAKKSQQQLVINHPFIKIVDNESWDLAKKSRTALKGGRTALQNQDSLIASALVKIRKEAGTIKEELILISKSAEDKQQEEVKRYEDEKQAVKRQSIDNAEAQRIENDRLRIEREKLEKEKKQIEAEKQKRIKEDEKKEKNILDKVKGFTDRLIENDYVKNYNSYKKGSYVVTIKQLRGLNEREFSSRIKEVNDLVNKAMEQELTRQREADQLKADQDKLKKEQETLNFQKREVILNKKTLFYNDETGCFENVYASIDASEVKTSDDATFNNLLADAIKKITDKLKEVKIELEKEVGRDRLNDLSKVGAARPIEELSTMSQDDFDFLLKEECEHYEAFLDNEKKIQDEKEEVEQKRIEALKPDIQLLNEYLDILSTKVEFPLIKTMEAQVVIKEIEKHHNDFIDKCREIVKSL
jgi:hypothetical protein